MILLFLMMMIMTMMILMTKKATLVRATFPFSHSTIDEKNGVKGVF